MIEKEYIERIQMLPFAGVLTDENRLDIGYVRLLLNTARINVLRDYYQKNNKRINPVAYQKHYPVFSQDLQESNIFVKFSCPEITTFDGNSDGLRYVGTIDCTTAFRRIWTRSMLSTINQHQVMSVKSDRYTAVLYDGASQMLEVYGNPEIEELMVEAVFTDPRSVPTWNPDKDQYPFPDDMAPMLEDYIFRNVTSIEASTQPETRSQFNQVAPQRRR